MAKGKKKPPATSFAAALELELAKLETEQPSTPPDYRRRGVTIDCSRSPATVRVVEVS